MRYLGKIFLATVFLGTIFFAGGYDEKIGSLMNDNLSSTMQASVFFTQSTTSGNLQSAYKSAISTKN